MTKYRISRARLAALKQAPPVPAKRNPGSNEAIGVLVAGAIAAGGAGLYLWSKRNGGMTLTVSSPLASSTSSLYLNGETQLYYTVTGGTPGDSVSVYYSTAKTIGGSAYSFVCGTCSGSFDAGGSFTATDTVYNNDANAFTFYIAAQDAVTLGGSNWVSITIAGGSGGGGNGSSGCTSNSQCGSCYKCLPWDGTTSSCQTQIPGNIVQTADLSGLTQDLGIASVGVPFTNIAVCDWTTVDFLCTNGNQGSGCANTWTASGQVVDANGVGVPCVSISVKSNTGSVSITTYPSSTDANGNFSFQFDMNTPDAGGASCPGPGDTTDGSIIGTFTVSIPGSGLSTTFPFAIKIYLVGI